MLLGYSLKYLFLRLMFALLLGHGSSVIGICHWYAEFFGMIFIKEDTMFYGIPYVKSHLENSFVYFL